MAKISQERPKNPKYISNHQNDVKAILIILEVFGDFCSFWRFLGYFSHYGDFKAFWLLQNLLSVFWLFQGYFNYFRNSMDIWSFQKFKWVFLSFQTFHGNVLVILRILGYFGHFGVSRGILVMFGNFDGILVLLEISRVFQ